MLPTRAEPFRGVRAYRSAVLAAVILLGPIPYRPLFEALGQGAPAGVTSAPEDLAKESPNVEAIPTRSDDPVAGVKFADGWTIKWGDSMETLALQFRDMILRPHSSSGFSAKDLAHDLRYATIDARTRSWKWRAGDGPVKNDFCVQDTEDGSASHCSLLRSNVVPKPFRGVELSFQKDRLYSAHMEMSPSLVPAMEATLTERLGRPTSRKSGFVQNGFGAQFDQAETTWSVGKVLVVLKLRDYGSVDSGGLKMDYTPISVPLAEKAVKESVQAPF